jgi:hypothetical protein
MEQHPFSYDDLLDYLAGHLDTKQMLALAEHLRTCHDCAVTIARFNAVRTLLRSDNAPEPPPRILSRAQAIFQPHHSAPRSHRFRFRFPSPIVSFSAGFAFALMLLFLAGSIIVTQDIPPDSVLYPVKAAVQGLRSVPNVGKPQSVQVPPTATSFLVNPTVPQPSSPADIVISQVYGGGGNTGAPFTHDFIELFNRGNTSVSLGGWSLQYTSATGSGNFGAGATQITELPAFTLAPGQYYLVQQARGSGGAALLPTPDFIDSTPMALSATGGKVALARTNTSLNCNGGTATCPPSALANIVDLVGYGRVDFYEGIGPAPESSNTTAVLRIDEGCKDTNSNLDDFILSAPNPRNSASPRYQCPPATKP